MIELDDYAHKILDQGQTTISNYLLKHYREIGISNQELFIYLLIKKDHDLVVPMPEMAELAHQTGYNEQQLFALFHQLIEKKLAEITRVTIEGQPVDAYDFTSLYEKLSLVKDTQVETRPELSNTNQPVDSTQRQAVFESIEKEFGRTLSPLEMEMISQWLDIDHYSAEMIRLALKETVLNQVYSLKYMDRILINWKKKNLQSAPQIEAYNKNRNIGKADDGAGEYHGPDIPFINLSGEDH